MVGAVDVDVGEAKLAGLDAGVLEGGHEAVGDEAVVVLLGVPQGDHVQSVVGRAGDLAEETFDGAGAEVLADRVVVRDREFGRDGDGCVAHLGPPARSDHRRIFS